MGRSAEKVLLPRQPGDVEASVLRGKLLALIKPDGNGKTDARLRLFLDERLGGGKAKRWIDFDGFVEVRAREKLF